MQVHPALPPRSAPPAQLPLHRAGAGFQPAFSEQIRAQLQGVGAAASPSATRAPAPSAWQYGTSTPDASSWAALACSIGGNYLSPSVADVFVRQMALESGNFSPDVISGERVSSAGAVGIAQLMPSSYPNVNARDPVQSLNAAAATMQANLARYGGNLAMALAAYNAGAGRVDEAMARAGINWQRDLPAETQQYLQLLLGTSA
jgi:soluble lytic murein transglycosylase-like protein